MCKKVSFPHKRAVLYIAYKPAHVALYASELSRAILDSELTMSHEGASMLELVTDLDNLMLIYVKTICRVVVFRKQLDKAAGFG